MPAWTLLVLLEWDILCVLLFVVVVVYVDIASKSLMTFSLFSLSTKLLIINIPRVPASHTETGP